MLIPFEKDDIRGRFLSQGQLAMVRSALTNILIYAETLQRKPRLTQEEKGRLEDIKRRLTR